MRILNLTAHQDDRWNADRDEYLLVFSIQCCGNVIVEQVVKLYDPTDDELEQWAAEKLKELFTSLGEKKC